MKLVVDSNRIFAALIKDSVSREILESPKFKFIGVHFSETEVKKYEKIILRKAGLSRKDYQKLFDLLFSRILLLDEQGLKENFFNEAFKVTQKIDESDTLFLALALQENCGIWSDDKHFKQQNKVKVYTTKQLIELL
ncbi:hypothetical protein KKG83_03690 [Candidatus Micrarchaeota archaeon]|nr:hypothetical protein [Candidatus Micrarchaeota archaeon]MBU2476547.1 hypothetical protein [Candidatus Micrarchaeota archaeon]